MSKTDLFKILGDRFNACATLVTSQLPFVQTPVARPRDRTSVASEPSTTERVCWRAIGV